MLNRRITTSISADGSTVCHEDVPPTVLKVPLALSQGGDSMARALHIQQVWAENAPTPSIFPSNDPRIKADAIPYDKNVAAGAFRCDLITLPNTMGDGRRLESMHSTPTLDLVVIIQGEVELIFPDRDPVVAKAGDVIVQGGVVHGWRNRGEIPVKMMAIMMGAEGEPQIGAES